jgi:hypothetical protein
MGYFSVEMIHAEYHPAKPGHSGQLDEPSCMHKVYRMQRLAINGQPDVAHRPV